MTPDHERAAAALRGVGLTAFGVAAIRARESGRPDALFDDPWSEPLVEAGRAAVLAGDDGAATWARVEDLVARFADGRAVAVRWFDDAITAAVRAGATQVVDLGAGLDTRAWRLPAVADLPFYELDRPEVLAFKAHVLDARPAPARRVAVPGDLTGDWLGALRDAGFDPARPTVWVEEGVFAYLTAAQVAAALAVLTSVTPAGSRLVKTALAVRTDDDTYRRLRAMVPAGSEPTAGQSGADRELALALGGQGWDVESVAHDAVAAEYGRAAVAGNPAADYLTATRRSDPGRS